MSNLDDIKKTLDILTNLTSEQLNDKIALLFPKFYKLKEDYSDQWSLHFVISNNVEYSILLSISLDIDNKIINKIKRIWKQYTHEECVNKKLRIVPVKY